MRAFAFYCLLSLPIIVWIVIVLPYVLATYDVVGAFDVASATVSAIVKVSPLIAGDVSILGEISPVILAGSIIALLPSSKGDTNVIAIILALVTYVLYIHLSIFFSEFGVALLSPHFHDTTEPKKIILSLVSNLRVTAVVVAASLIGFKFKNAT